MSDPRHTVLVVDDERHVLTALQRTLRGEPYRIVVADHPLRALELVETEAVDIVISDIDMPEMDGVELISRIRKSHPQIVRMLLTGGASLESAMQAINDGEVHRYLTKPWDGDELRALLRDTCARIDELRRAAMAGQRVGQRERLLVELEREHPRIRDIALVDGTYIVDAGRITAIVAELADDGVRAFFAPAPADEEEPWKS